MNVDHLTKFLKRKLRKGVYGSVLIHIKDGKVSGVQVKDDFNAEAFEEHVEHLERKVTRYIAKNKGNNKQEVADIDKKSVQNEQNCTELLNTGEIDNKNVEIVANTDNKSDENG